MTDDTTTPGFGTPPRKKTSWGDVVQAALDYPQPVAPPAPAPVTPAAPEPVAVPVQAYTPAVQAYTPAPEFTPAPVQAYTPPVQNYALPQAEPAAFPYTSPAPDTASAPSPFDYGVSTPAYIPAVKRGPSAAAKLARLVVAAVVLAGVGFGGYWAYDRYVKADHTSAAAEAPANPDSAPAVNPPAPQVPSAAPAPVPAPVVPASPPAYTGGGDEQTYLSLLRNRSDMTITDPARLLELGKEVCVYLGTQSGPTTVVMGNVKDLLGREGTSGTEWVHITAAAVTTLCPEHKSKILP